MLIIGEYHPAFACFHKITRRHAQQQVRIGMITAEVKLGESWCDASKVGRAIFLDTFF